MSNKRYNFYRYTAGDIFHLFTWLKELRKQYIAHVQADLKRFGKKLSTDVLLDKVQSITNAGFNGPFNINASVAVFPHKDKIYVQLFGVPQELLPKEGLEDCFYSDQADKPECFSDEEWARREQITDEIFVEGRASHDGLCFVLADKYDVYMVVYTMEDK